MCAFEFACYLVRLQFLFLSITYSSTLPINFFFFFFFPLLFQIHSYGIQRIDIVLDNADGVFLAGKSVTGKVMLELAAPLEVLGK